MTDTHVLVPRADTVPSRSIMHPVVAKMMETNPTPEALEKLLQMQREWEAAEAKRAFTAALVELKAALPPFLKRDKTVDFTSAKGRTHYTHTSLGSAMEEVTPHLTRFGFSLTWKPGTTDKGLVKVTATLTHRLGHSESSCIEAGADTTGNKNGPQAVASTITLLARYTTLGLLGLATADMAEPTGEATTADLDQIDTSRNMRAMSDLAKAGKSREQCEKFVDKPLTKWTHADLDKLRAWLDKPATGSSAASEEIIGKAETDAIDILMKKYSLTPIQFGDIVTEEIGRKPKGRSDLKKSEFEKIRKLFVSVDAGAVNLRDGKIQRPVDAEPAGTHQGDDDIPF